jgi:hypothetical protein
MSQVRRAMAEMGLAGCCAWCDAPDTPGSERCRACIGQHRKVRDRLASGADAPVDRAARELLGFMAEPHRHDHDPVHGPILLEQQARLGVYRERKANTVEDMEAAFAASRARTKTSVVAEVASQQGEAPEAEEARLIGVQAFDPEQLVADVQRTNPSRAIPKVDRSDRLGEDPELVARLNAERDAAADAEVDVERAVKERLERRGELSGLLDDLDAMLDD